METVNSTFDCRQKQPGATDRLLPMFGAAEDPTENV